MYKRTGSGKPQAENPPLVRKIGSGGDTGSVAALAHKVTGLEKLPDIIRRIIESTDRRQAETMKLIAILTSKVNDLEAALSKAGSAASTSEFEHVPLTVPAVDLLPVELTTDIAAVTDIVAHMNESTPPIIETPDVKRSPIVHVSDDSDNEEPVLQRAKTAVPASPKKSKDKSKKAKKGKKSKKVNSDSEDAVEIGRDS
jgi:hypothetical protein